MCRRSKGKSKNVKGKSENHGLRAERAKSLLTFSFCPSPFYNPAIPKTAAKSLVTEADGRTDARLGRLVRLLADHPMVVMSGTKLAAELGISRDAVWRLVQQLRELGVEIAGRPHTGYQLEQVPDLLLPEVLEPLVRGTRFAGKLHHYFRVDSTNSAALAAATQDAPEGSVFLAEEQTAGRGRGGHSWSSERNAGIYCSVLLRPQLGPADVLMLSLLTGLAVADAVTAATGVRPDLRWPNDLLFGSGKFCGILIELNAEATRLRHAVVGIGINVNQSQFAAPLRDIATSLLLETGRTTSRVALAAAVLKALDREYEQLLATPAEARASLMRRFEAASSTARGRRVRVEEEGGYEGTTEGLDERGFLRIRTNQGINTVLSGGVRAV